MVPVALPPGIHPVTAERPASAEVKLHTKIRNKKGIVEQIGFQTHVKRLEGIANGSGHLYRVTNNNGSLDSVTKDDRIPCFRLFLINGDFPVISGNYGSKLTFDHGTVTEFGKKMFGHITPHAPATQIHQLSLAGINHFTAPNHPHGSITKNTEDLVTAGHVRLPDKDGEALPVFSRGEADKHRIGDGKTFPHDGTQRHEPFIGQASVQHGIPFRGSAGTQAYTTQYGMFLQGADARKKGVQTRAIVPVGKIRNGTADGEIEPAMQGVTTTESRTDTSQEQDQNKKLLQFHKI